MKKWTITFFLVIIFIVQFSTLSVFLKTKWVPNLFLLFAISLIILFGFDESWEWIVVCGLLMDAGANWLWGTGTLVMIVIAWLVNELKIIAEFRSRRYIFLVILSLLFVVSSLAFDFSIHFLTALEKQMGISKNFSFDFYADTDYLAKLIFSIICGLAIYSFSRKIKDKRNSGIFVR
jgi:rod shape-determining protein MreD